MSQPTYLDVLLDEVCKILLRAPGWRNHSRQPTSVICPFAPAGVSIAATGPRAWSFRQDRRRLLVAAKMPSEGEGVEVRHSLLMRGGNVGSNPCRLLAHHGDRRQHPLPSIFAPRPGPRAGTNSDAFPPDQIGPSPAAPAPPIGTCNERFAPNRRISIHARRCGWRRARRPALEP